MTDEEFIKACEVEAIRRLDKGAGAGWAESDCSVQVLAQTLRELDWQPPVDPRVIKVRDYLCRYFTPHSTFPWDIALVEKHAAEILKLVEGSA